MKTDITYWQNVILSNKNIEPKNDEQVANYKMAEYLLFRQNEKLTA